MNIFIHKKLNGRGLMMKSFMVFSLLDAANFVANAVAVLADGITFDAQKVPSWALLLFSWSGGASRSADVF